VNAKMVLAVAVSLAAAALPLLASERGQGSPPGAACSGSVGSRLGDDAGGSEAAPAVAVIGSMPSASAGGAPLSHQIAGEPSVPLAFVCTGLLGLIAHYLRVRRV